MREYKKKVISLQGNKKLINACKKVGLSTFNPIGEWNRYGYTKLPMAVEINSLKEMRKFNKLKKELGEVKSAPQLSEEEKIQKWAERLSKLTDCELSFALELANDKLTYHNEQIDALLKRQDTERYSHKREQLIRKMERENPLRYIKNKEHAYAILGAHNRHLSDYDEKLKYIHELEKNG